MGSIGVAVVLLVVWSSGCAGKRPPPPRTGYKAHVTIEMKGVSGENPVRVQFLESYFKRMRRREATMDGVPVVSIDRPDLLVSWKLNPVANTFDEYRLASHRSTIGRLPDPFTSRPETRFKRLGTEELDGVAAEKYEVDGGWFSGHAWFTTDRIPFRFLGTVQRKDSSAEFEIRYADITRGSLADELFEIPSTYAGYERRTQKRSLSPRDLNEMERELRESRPTLPPQLPPPPPPPMPTY